MFWSSIGYDIHSLYELESGLGLCSFNNLVVDPLQEATYFFSARVKADSDSGVDWPEKKNLRGGTPCKILVVCFIQQNLLNIKKSSVGEPLAELRLLSSVAPPLLDSLRRPRALSDQVQIMHFI